jgi:hypothetical protein
MLFLYLLHKRVSDPALSSFVLAGSACVAYGDWRKVCSWQPVSGIVYPANATCGGRA